MLPSCYYYYYYYYYSVQRSVVVVVVVVVRDGFKDAGKDIFARISGGGLVPAYSRFGNVNFGSKASSLSPNNTF